MAAIKVIAHPLFVSDLAAAVQAGATESPVIIGRVLDSGTVFHLDRLSSVTGLPEDQLEPGMRRIGTIVAAGRSRPAGHALIVRYDQNSGESWAEVIDEMNTIRAPIEKPDLSRLFARVDARATALAELSQKRVVVVGLGSGGSLLALYLAKSGVKHLTFIDGDRLDVHNVVRHICSLADVGRFKTLAVRDYIQARVPGVSIETRERLLQLDTQEAEADWRRIFEGADLIVSASGDHSVNYAVNSLAYSTKPVLPVIYAGTFASIAGGLLFLADPAATTPCYECFYGGHASSATGSIEIASDEARVEYDRSEEDKLSQPGLGLDVDNLTVFLAKFCLSFLVRGAQHGLYKFEHPFYVWSNREHSAIGHRFDALELTYYEAHELRRDPACRICGGGRQNGR